MTLENDPMGRCAHSDLSFLAQWRCRIAHKRRAIVVLDNDLVVCLSAVMQRTRAFRRQDSASRTLLPGVTKINELELGMRLVTMPSSSTGTGTICEPIAEKMLRASGYPGSSNATVRFGPQSRFAARKRAC